MCNPYLFATYKNLQDKRIESNSNAVNNFMSARPRKKMTEKLEEIKSIRMTKKMVAVLEDLASKQDRTFSAECARRIRKTLIDEGFKPSEL